MDKIDVLVVGGGGREHALCWKLRQSDQLGDLYCVPGNAGIDQIARTADISYENVEAVADFAEKKDIDLTVAGPEKPLALGIADAFEERNLPLFGPSSRGARVEASKVFTRNLAREQGIPSPGYSVFDAPDHAKEYLAEKEFPIVVKADGLAAGKGSLVCDDLQEAEEAVDAIMVDRKFGEAGAKVVVEEFLEGVEASLLAICQGTNLVVLAPSQDHKQIYEGDRGPNTGGMGAYCPTPFVGDDLQEQVIEDMFLPTLHALHRKGIEYTGVLYAGLMLTRNGPRLLEYNVRFGDPEAQPIVQRMDSDLLPYLYEATRGNLDRMDPIDWKSRHSMCVVAASEGYPISYDTGYRISGVKEAEQLEDVVVFQAGTDRKKGDLVTAGGRVLGVTALGDNLQEARDQAYAGMDKIEFRGMQYREDIGHLAL